MEVDAYGLTLRIGAATQAPAGPRTLDLVQGDPDAPMPEPVFEHGRHVRELLLGGWMDIDLGRRRATFHKPGGIGDEELLHPYAGPAAASFAHWNGLETFHASTVVVAGRAWALLGPRETGKSTMTLLCHLAGDPVLTDDLLIVDHDDAGDLVALPGPGFVDLRRPTADWYRTQVTGQADAADAGDAADAADAGGGRGELVPVRDGERWRLRTGDALTSPVPFAGWVILAEGPDLEVETVPVPDRVAALLDHRYIAGPHPDPTTWLDASTRAMLRLTRPKDFARHPDVIAAFHHATTPNPNPNPRS